MAQNSQRLQWSDAEVDSKLKDIMTNCYKQCLDAGIKWTAEGAGSQTVMPSLLSGANVAGFVKVADAMKAQGDWW